MNKFISYSILFLALTVFSTQKSYCITKTVGASGADYTTLKGAFDAINAGTITGAITLQVVGNTTETASAVLNASGNGSASYSSVFIYPTVVGKTISGNIAGALIQLNGADNVTINGSLNQGNLAKDLTISNTGTNGQAIVFINDASNNNIKYCIITGSNSTIYSGVVVFSTAVTTGNNNNTIDNCNITASGTNYPANLIYSLGTASKDNSTNTITNCNLFNFRGAMSAAIKDSANTTDWAINNNSIYQTTAYTCVAGTTYGIYINNTSGNSFSIVGNYIGGNSALCNGTWTTNSSTVNNRFVGMYLNVGSTVASSIQTNTIQNFNWYSSGTNFAAPGTWCAVYVVAGNVGIGNNKGNVIGNSVVTGSILVTNSTNNTCSYGIINASSGTVNISNNTIGSITVAGSVAGNSHSLYLIDNTNTATTTNITINNNLIGSLTTPKSINTPTLGGTGTPVKQYINCILNLSAGSIFITNNTIANINNDQDVVPASAFNAMIFGIYTLAGTNTITGNTIKNLSAKTTSVLGGTGINSSLIGIAMTSPTLGGQTISNNTIHSFTNSYTGTNLISIAGIVYDGPTSGTNIVSKNIIHSLSVASSSTSSKLNGIYITSGTTTYQNNMIQLGLKVDGTAITNGYVINGIYDSTGTNNFYYNSIYIGGAGVSGTTSSTYAFNSLVTTNVRNIKDNIFFNNRSGGTTGKHYAVKIGGTTVNPTGLTSNNNDYYVGTGGVLAYYNAADRTTLAAWQTAIGQDANTISGDPQFNTPDGTAISEDLHINPITLPPTVAAGTPIAGITDDIDGNTRNTTMPCIGADELLPCSSPTIQPTGLTFVSTTTSTTASFNPSPNVDHYLVVRSTNATLTASPVNNTIYVAGNTFGGGISVAYQSTTTFTDINLVANTKYYYFVFAVNANCTGGPLYLTTSPLIGSVAIIHDVYVSRIINPTDTIAANSVQNVSICFKNKGAFTENSILLGYQRNTLTPVLENWSGSIAPGDSVIYNFLSTFVANTSGPSFTLCAYTKMTSDQDTTNDKLCKTIVFSSNLGINTISKAIDFKLFPNPAHDKLNISFSNINKGLTRFTIYNMQGLKLYDDQINITTDTYNKTINVNNLKSGIYFLKIENNSQAFNKKFVVD